MQAFHQNARCDYKMSNPHGKYILNFPFHKFLWPTHGCINRILNERCQNCCDVTLSRVGIRNASSDRQSIETMLNFLQESKSEIGNMMLQKSEKYLNTIISSHTYHVIVVTINLLFSYRNFIV